MRFDLKVPFAEKDEAKKLGARWDPARKLWHVDDARVELALFERWRPQPHDAGAPLPPPSARRSAGARGAATGGSEVQRGAAFVEQTRDCACSPWEDCPRCRR